MRAGPAGLPRGELRSDMARNRRIGILTGGGDVPGLNSVIKSVTYRATELGFDVFGIRRGWEGLTHQQPGSQLDERYVIRLDRINTRTIDRTGGTWLHSSRTNPRKMRRAALPPHLDAARAERMRVGEDRFDITPVVLENIEAMGLDYLVPIGGDDTLSFSQALHDAGVPLIAIPKTMDNDVQGTEYCIGFSTAITRAKDAIKSPSPRRWTTTSRAPSTASASRRPSRAPRTPSTGSARPSGRTSASASSASSDGMPASRPSTPPS
jgi:6-phosphofructokinase